MRMSGDEEHTEQRSWQIRDEEEKINKSKDNEIKTIKSETGKKTCKKMQLQGALGNFKWPVTCVAGVPEKRRGEEQRKHLKK